MSVASIVTLATTTACESRFVRRRGAPTGRVDAERDEAVYALLLTATPAGSAPRRRADRPRRRWPRGAGWARSRRAHARGREDRRAAAPAGGGPGRPARRRR